MRPRGQISAAGSIVVILIAALGFAAVSADAPPEPEVSPATLPSSLSARVAAAGFAAVLNPVIDTAEAIPVQPAETPRVAPATTTPPQEPTTTTTTAAAPPATTTTTTAAPPPTTAAPTTTTTTTTAAPTTTVAPTTTTAAPATSTTAASTTTTTTAPPVEGGARDVEEWRSLVEQFFSGELVDEALEVMRCESRGDPLAYNSTSGASGLFQFIPSTWAWASAGAGFTGATPFDPSANVGAASWLVQRSIDQGKDAWTHWSCKP